MGGHAEDPPKGGGRLRFGYCRWRNEGGGSSLNCGMARRA